MIKNLKILAISFLLISCGKHVGSYNKEDSKIFTSSFETETGGSISNHIVFGESSLKIIDRAKLRCKKISPKSKVKNLRLTFQGTLVTDQMSIFEYDCK